MARERARLVEYGLREDEAERLTEEPNFNKPILRRRIDSK